MKLVDSGYGFFRYNEVEESKGWLFASGREEHCHGNCLQIWVYSHLRTSVNTLKRIL